MTEDVLHNGNPPPTPAGTPSSTSKEVLRCLKDWFLEQGGGLCKVNVAPINSTEGCGLVAHEDVAVGDAVLRVPLALCLHVEALERSVLCGVVAAEPQLLEEEAQDELLALMLMAERRAANDSFWWPYLKSMPGEYDTPLYWSEEERRHLAGTNVGLLTTMMERRIAQDWQELHAGLVQRHADVLDGLTLQDYTWALSTIWSRAVGVDRGEGQRYLRCLAPTLDMCNHHPQAASGLEDILKFDPEDNSLCFRPGTAVATGHQCHLLYGPYSNAKLLFSYGFVAPNNPYRGVDYWVKVPPSAPDAAWKNEQLQAHALTREQTYDFQGTLRGNGVTTALLATLRLIHLTPDEYGKVDKVFRGEEVSTKNEQASFQSLAMFLEKKLKAYPTTIEEDLVALEKLERMLEVATHGEEETEAEIGLRIGVLLGRRQTEKDQEQQQSPPPPQQQQQQQQQPPKVGLRRALRRRACALKVVLEDKLVVQDTLACITHRLGELKLAEEAKAQGLD